MAKALAHLLAALDRIVSADAARRDATAKAQDGATRTARRLLLVHRTGGPSNRDSWRQILHDRRLCAQAPATEREKAIDARDLVYFFFGCAAYPDGIMAFMIEPLALQRGRDTFTPFDTGALTRYSVPRAPDVAATWDEAARCRHLEEHLGDGCDVAAFAGPFLAAHFQEPLDYVRRPQRSEPDHAPYHGLMSTSGDRRAWTIEAQLRAHVSVDPGDAPLAGVVLGDKDLLAEMPAEFLPVVYLSASEDEVAVMVADEIARRVESEDR